MKTKLFWAGLIGINLLCSFTFSLTTGTLVFIVASFVWWWVVFRSRMF